MPLNPPDIRSPRLLRAKTRASVHASRHRYRAAGTMRSGARVCGTSRPAMGIRRAWQHVVGGRGAVVPPAPARDVAVVPVGVADEGAVGVQQAQRAGHPRVSRPRACMRWAVAAQWSISPTYCARRTPAARPCRCALAAHPPIVRPWRAAVEALGLQKHPARALEHPRGRGRSVLVQHPGQVPCAAGRACADRPAVAAAAGELHDHASPPVTQQNLAALRRTNLATAPCNALVGQQR